MADDARKPLRYGVIELHTFKNEALIKDFYATVDDLKRSGSIVDLWVMDIAAVLGRHGYEMVIYKSPVSAPLPDGEQDGS